MNIQNELTTNFDKLHTTKMGIDRIKRNLSLNCDDVIGWCIRKITSENVDIKRKGKNWYIFSEDCVFTVNSYSYTIITAHKLKTGKSGF